MRTYALRYEGLRGAVRGCEGVMGCLDVQRVGTIPVLTVGDFKRSLVQLVAWYLTCPECSGRRDKKW
jgi:predicted metal-binding protein